MQELNTTIARKEEKYKEVINQLQKTPQYTITRDKIDEKWMNIFRGLLEEDNYLGNLTIEKQELNPLYLQLESEIYILEQDLSDHRAERNSLTEKIGFLKEEIMVLQKDIAEKETYNSLKQSYEIALNNYLQAEESYSSAQQLLESMYYEITNG